MARLFAAATLCIGLIACGAVAAEPVRAGTATRGGAVAGARVIHVTTLADSGPGSLRAAAGQSGPRVVVFDIGGTIDLASDLRLSSPDLTIAGQSAPSLVILRNGSLRIRTHDVVVQHLAVRPGPSGNPRIDAARDSITIGGGREPARDIRLEQVSTSWSVDENIAITGATTRNITILNAIVADALNRAGNPRGRHAMGMLIDEGAEAVAVTGTLFANNMFRNPVLARGVSAFISGNAIFNPGENSVHLYAVSAAKPLRAAIAGNVIVHGPDSDSNITALQIPPEMAERARDAIVYAAGNRAPGDEITNRGGLTLAKTPPVVPLLAYEPPRDVAAWVLGYAGARPGERDAVDARIVRTAADGTGRILDRPEDAGPLSTALPLRAASSVPASPFAPSSLGDLTRIEAWLCQRHFEVGGPPTPECSEPPARYREALARSQP